MKKIYSILLLMALIPILFACTATPTLYIVNWGDYMDPELVEAFEEEHHVKISEMIATSNEAIAGVLQRAQSPYDLAIPSEYMIQKLIELDLIVPVDYSRMPNFQSLTVIPKLTDLYDGLGIADYVVPYAWGTIGIMYNTTGENASIGALLEAEDWNGYFGHTDVYQVGMYDSARDSVAAALMSLGYSVNSEDPSELAEAEQLLISADFAWGEDLLRSSVIQESLDMALVYSGDYFSEYFLALEDRTPINFAFYVPETTNVWMDAFVVAKTSKQTDLAYEFMNYLLGFETGIQNYDYIGYAPCYEEFFEEMTTNPDYGYDLPDFDPFPDGSLRAMYVYGSDARSQRITEILNNAKGQD